MIERQTLRFFTYYLRAYPGASAAMVSLLVLSGVLEGVGILSLVPLLAIASGNGMAAEVSGISRAVTATLGVFGLEPTLGVLVSMIVVSITVKAVALWLGMRQVGFTTARVGRDLRLSLIRALLRARWSYFGTQPLGRYANAISNETTAASNAYREACTMLAALVQILIYVTVSLLVSWQATAVALIVGGGLFVMLRHFIGMSRSAGKEQVQLTKSLSGRIVEALEGIKAIKAMALEDRVLPILERETEELNRAHQKRVVAAETPRMIQEPVAALVLGLGLYAFLVVQQQPFATVLVLAFIFQRLVSHMNTLHLRYQLVVNGEAAFWSVREQVALAEAEVESDAALSSGVEPELGRSIRFDRVAFGFPNKPLFEGMSLSIAAGSFVALSGPSGVGKTTIVDLLVGLQRPQSGTVYLDDVPLRDVNLRAWRSVVGYVPQETLLFNDTIRHNVTLGDVTITDERVEWALRAAGAWEFVMERAGGLDNVVGNAGTWLSGGQRQRLAIARALVRRPTLLILDEATAALDPASEAAICATLDGLRGTITIIAISHQSMLRDAADVVYAIADGRARQVQNRVVLAVPG